MLPNCLAVGVPYELFWHLTPKKLKAFEKAYDLKRKVDDEKAYMQGVYNLKAFEVVLSHIMAGLAKKKCDNKYFKEPLLRKNADGGELSEEEKQRQREEFVAMLERMKARFDAAHEKTGDDNEL